MITFDSMTNDSLGAFLNGELERLDQKLHEPLVEFTWRRDIDLREDVTIADEVSSFTLSNFGANGGLGTGNAIGSGKSWVGKNSSQISSVSVDIAKIANPLMLWAIELAYTIPELESSMKLGRPIDQQKFQAMKKKYEMDIDEQVYIGDTTMNKLGLVNCGNVTPVNAAVAGSTSPTGQAASTKWIDKTADEIVADVVNAQTNAWAATGWSVPPDRILLPPAQFGYISSQKVSSAGNISILRYILENNLLTNLKKGDSGEGKTLSIQPCKWLAGAGVGGTIGTPGTDRMVAYTKNEDFVRFPLTLLSRTPLQYESLYQKTTYFGRLGVVEIVYPETVSYVDGI
jgi:hypothetical protein